MTDTCRLCAALITAAPRIDGSNRHGVHEHVYQCAPCGESFTEEVACDGPVSDGPLKWWPTGKPDKAKVIGEPASYRAAWENVESDVEEVIP